jgi:hypothetical protein
MTQRAQKIVDATMELTLRPQQGDRARFIACALREIIDELQYYQCCREEGVEDMVIDSRAAYDLADELEALYNFENQNQNPPLKVV